VSDIFFFGIAFFFSFIRRDCHFIDRHIFRISIVFFFQYFYRFSTFSFAYKSLSSPKIRFYCICWFFSGWQSFIAIFVIIQVCVFEIFYFFQTEKLLWIFCIIMLKSIFWIQASKTILLYTMYYVKSFSGFRIDLKTVLSQKLQNHGVKG